MLQKYLRFARGGGVEQDGAAVWQGGLVLPVGAFELAVVDGDGGAVCGVGVQGFGAQEDGYGGVGGEIVRLGGQFAQCGLHAIGVDDAAADAAALSDELGHLKCGGVLVEILWLVPLNQFAVLHQADLVGEGEGFLLVVGYHQGGGVLLFEQLAHVLGKAVAQVGIEIGKGFVQ